MTTLPAYSPAGLAALEAVHHGRVFRTPSRPYVNNPRRMTRPGWLSTTHTLTRPMEKALDELLTLGALDVSAGANIAVRLAPTGSVLLGEWERAAARWDRAPRS